MSADARQRFVQVDPASLASDLELLAAIGQDFAASAAMGETLANAVRQIMQYMQTEAASIFLLDPAGHTLSCVACAGPVQIEGLSIAAGQGIVGRAVASRCVQMVRDVAADGGFSGAVDALTGFRTRSILCAPLQIKGEMLGALEVINRHSDDGLFDENDRQLLQALAGMVSLAVHNARMAEALVEQERMRRELDLAREIQRGLLPQPIDGVPVHGLNVPANEVSGDFFDYFPVADGRVLWGIGDVSGKGMNAALLMAKTIALLRCLGKRESDPARLLAQLNDEIAETARLGMFVTMIAGIYEPASGTIALANAGHQPALWRRGDGSYAEIDGGGPPLGVLSGVEYATQRIALEDGRLYLYTDGVTEGRTAQGTMLELSGLQTLLERHPGSPQEQLEAVAAALTHPGRRLHDDLTLMVLG